MVVFDSTGKQISSLQSQEQFHEYVTQMLYLFERYLKFSSKCFVTFCYKSQY